MRSKFKQDSARTRCPQRSIPLAIHRWVDPDSLRTGNTEYCRRNKRGGRWAGLGVILSNEGHPSNIDRAATLLGPLAAELPAC